MKIWKQSVLFYLGGMLYAALELLWRGWTHGSMFALGGLCFVTVGQLGQSRLPLPLKVLGGAATITSLELLGGLLVNRDYTIWDYRGKPPHFMGHICLQNSLLWVPVSLAAIVLYDVFDRRIKE